MLETDEDTRLFDRRLYERRLEEFLAERTGHCHSLHMRLTLEGCRAIRMRDDPPIQCKHCQGVDIEESRTTQRRSGEDRRTSNLL